MLSRGIFHAVTDDDLKRIRSTKDGPKRRELVLEWDEIWPEEFRCSTDKSWRFISVALSYQPGPCGGRPDEYRKRRSSDGHEIVLGLGKDMFHGKSLHKPNFHVIGLVPNEWLPDIVNSLESLDEARYRELYFSAEVQSEFACRCFIENHGIDPTEDQWCDYSWTWLQRIRVLFRKALVSGRSLVFSATNC